jgi:ankyrin repeat protein
LKRSIALWLFILLAVTYQDVSAQKAEQFWKPIFENNIAEVKRLIRAGVNVNEKIDWAVWRHVTALYFSVMFSRAEICNALLDAGADVKVVYPEGDSILHVAAQFDSGPVIIERLIAKGADVNAKWPDLGGNRDATPLHVAAAKGRLGVARVLIEHGADVNAKTFLDGYSPLHFAVGNGHKEVAELLIAQAADVNAKSGTGATPLDLAMDNGKEELADLLRKHGGHSGRR